MDSGVLSRFIRNTSDGSEIKFRIKDNFTSGQVESIADIFIKHFYPDEALSIATGVAENPHALAELRAMFIDKFMGPPYSCIICCEDTEDIVEEITGIFLMKLMKEDDSIKMKEVETKEVEKLIDLCQAVHNTYNPIKKLGISCWYADIGIVVNPKFRNMGIATEIFRTVPTKCKKDGVPVFGAIMTSAAAQKAAAKLNWKTVFEETFEEFGRQNGVTFRDVPDTIKFMIYKDCLPILL